MAAQESLSAGRRFIPATQVKRRYGVTEMTVFRWIRDPRMGFPQPIKIRGRNYFDEAELENYDERHLAARRSIDA